MAFARPLAAVAFALLIVLVPRASVAADAAAELPFDAAVVRGELPNGLHYFLLENAKPEQRVELRLALRVGSVQETEEERGIAHFCEHMNFNGSEHFKSGELVDYLESIGARFGADSNAYTSYDETVYMLQVPTDKDGALEKGLLILSDWAGRATLDGIEIDKERGVVGDELRGNKGAFKRIRDRQDQDLFRGSRYADRNTIGLESVLQHAPHDVLRGFYKRWYRPELMAVVIVGQFDLPAIEARVKELFGSLPASPSATVVPSFDVPPQAETIYRVDSDPELTVSSVSIQYKHGPHPQRTAADVREQFLASLAGSILTERLSERAQSANPPFLGAGAGLGNYVKTLDVFSLGARAKDGELLPAAAALMEELERARRHGFVQEELERVKAEVLTSAENAWKERDERRSRSVAGALVASFLEDRPFTSEDFDYELTQQLLPGIGLDEVNAALVRLTATTSRVVFAQAPEKPGAVPALVDLREAIEPAGGREVQAYVDDLAGQSLSEPPSEPGRIVSQHAIPELGVVELGLSNGVRVIVKSTHLRADQIILRAHARGGTWGLPASERLSAGRSAQLASLSGTADFTAPQVTKLLAGKAAGAGPSLSSTTRDFFGGSTPKDFETMVQLVNLYFTRPAFREQAFRRMIDSSVESLRNGLNSPRGVYSRQRGEVLYSGSELFRTPTPEEVAALDIADLERHYREFFSDPSEWTFVLVGNVDLDVHGPQIATWLGGIPAVSHPRGLAGRPALADGLRVAFPQGRASRMVVKGVEDQAQTSYSVRATWRDDDDGFLLDAAADVLRIRLRERLREERGDTYGVGVSTSSLLPAKEHARLEVSFGSSPDTRGDMSRDVQEEIARLREELPSEAEISKIRELRLKALADGEQENGWWLARLADAYEEDRDPRAILKARERVDQLTPRAVRRAARRLLHPQRTVEVFLVPEEWGPARWMAHAPAAGTPGPALP